MKKDVPLKREREKKIKMAISERVKGENRREAAAPMTSSNVSFAYLAFILAWVFSGSTSGDLFARPLNSISYFVSWNTLTFQRKCHRVS